MNTILICDDDKDIVSALDIYLTSEGYATVKAYDGLECLRLAEREPVDLILLDVMMPGLDGIRTTAKLRESCNVPIILLTAKSEDSDKILGLNIGADDYITSPSIPSRSSHGSRASSGATPAWAASRAAGRPIPPCSPTAASRWMTGPNRSPWTGRGSASPPSSTTSFSC